MTRLVDYVVVLGFDFDKYDGTEGKGCVIQRFPTESWSDYPYEFHLESFCQPIGWHLTEFRPAPTFFVAHLTDVQGSSYYAACLTFHEAVTTEQLLRINAMKNASGQFSATTTLPNGVYSSRHGPFLNAVRTSPTCSSLISSESIESLNICPTSSMNYPHPAGRMLLVPPSASSNSAQAGTNVQDDPNLVRPADWYSPKCLVLLARHQHFDVLKNSLSLLYTVFANATKQISMEHIIASLLGSVKVPSPGGPRISFSLGAGDRQMIQPAHCGTIPVTQTYVARLFKYLGIHNVILLFSAILSDNKVLLCSRSLCRLTECGQALVALLYPLKYGHTFVPILPKSLIEYLNAPIPFLYGIHSSYRNLLPDLGDVYVADLDGGSVMCPESLPSVPIPPAPYYDKVVDNLFQILSPELLSADHIYPPEPSAKPQALIEQDKELRAVFIRLFASLFAGYRSCLSITRIHPQPVLHFNRSLFLMLRMISSHNEFFDRILSSMRFHQFIHDRGPPFRVCDIFDEVYDSASLSTLEQAVASVSPTANPSPRIERSRIAETTSEGRATDGWLSRKLLENECGSVLVEHVLPDEAAEAHKRLHQPPFPLLDSKLIDQLVSDSLRNKTFHKQHHKAEPRFVPGGLVLDRQLFKAEMFSDKNRVIQEFVADIFQLHITEALKRRNTIRQDLKSRAIRRLFVDELQRYVVPPSLSVANARSLPDNPSAVEMERNECEERALLTWEQFDLIVDLLDEALCLESQSEDSGIAPMVMDLSTRFAAKLQSVRYYANMTPQLQRHQIWEDMSFWENVFYECTNNQLRQMYLHFGQSDASQADHHQSAHSSSPNVDDPSLPAGKVLIVRTEEKSLPVDLSKPSVYTSAMSSLEIAAEEMRQGGSRSTESQRKLESQEENTVYAQIIHIINLIVNFRIPVDVGAWAAGVYGNSGEALAAQFQADDSSLNDNSSTNNPTASNFQSREAIPDAATGEPRQTQDPYVVSSLSHINSLEQWIQKFVEKLSDENNLSLKRITELNEKIEGIIEAHLSSLESIYPEVKNTPKIKKPEIADPTLLSNEVLIPIANHNGVRCNLLVDGRLERTDWQWLDISGDLSNANPRDSLSDRHTISNSTSGTAGVETEVEVDAMVRPLLPAEGALFLTNYRVIFTGVPKDPYQSNKVITRSFPIAALYSVKKMGTMRITTIFPATTSAVQSNLPATTSGKSAHTLFTGKRQRNVPGSKQTNLWKHRTGRKGSQIDIHMGGCRGLVRIDENLDVISLRSSTMQLINLGFDANELSHDTRDHLLKLLSKLRYPATLQMGFNALPNVDASGRLMHDHHHSRKPSTGPAQRSAVDIRSNSSVTSHVEHASAKVLGIASAPLASIASEFHRSSDCTTAILMVLSNDMTVQLDHRIQSVFSESPGYIDMAYFGLCSTGSVPQSMDTSNVRTRTASIATSASGGSNATNGARLIAHNSHYELARSYPALLVVPHYATLKCLQKVSRSYRQGRFPVVTWQHPNTGAYLLRGSGFHSKSILSAFRHAPTNHGLLDPKDGSSEAGESTSSSKEHVRYLVALVDMSIAAIEANTPATTLNSPFFLRSALDPSSPVSMNAGDISSFDAELKYRASVAALRSIGKKTRSLGRLPTFTRKHGDHTPLGSMTSDFRDDSTKSTGGSAVDLSGSNRFRHHKYQSSAASSRPIYLYLLGEKSTAKTMSKHTNIRNIEFVHVDYVCRTDVAKSFKHLIKACLPVDYGKNSVQSQSVYSSAATSGLSAASGSSAHYQTSTGDDVLGARSDAQTTTSSAFSSVTVQMAVMESGWLNQLQSALQLAGVVVDLLDLEGASVAVCLEDGSDAVTLTVSLAQVMLDPHYRTLAGFWALIEKEWLMFGHRFNQRLGQTESQKSENISPIFLQFLDAVHQILRQFPLSFEFNDFYLQFLAYHHLSNRFHNFKYDSEMERHASWFSIHDGLQSAAVESTMARLNATSIWPYIQTHHEEWPVFFNFRYSHRLGGNVLRPTTNVASLDVWKFYVHEDLASGPIYDLDHFSPSYRKQLVRPYEPVLRDGLNNSHVEHVYAVLGLREGEEAIGWRSAWEQAQDDSANFGVSDPLRKKMYHKLRIRDSRVTSPDRYKPNNQHAIHPGQTDQYPVLRRTSSRNLQLNGGMTNVLPQGSVDRSINEMNMNFSSDFHAHQPAGLRSTLVHQKSCSDEGLSDDTEENFGLNRPTDVLGDLSFDEDSADECMVARSVALSQHHATTLQRIARCDNVLCPVPYEDPIRSSVMIGAETESLTSGSMHSGIRSIRLTNDMEESQTLFSTPHKFHITQTSLPNARCQFCQRFIISFGVARNVALCSNCGYFCHAKCTPHVPKQCHNMPTINGNRPPDRSLADLHEDQVRLSRQTDESNLHVNDPFQRNGHAGIGNSNLPKDVRASIKMRARSISRQASRLTGASVYVQSREKSIPLHVAQATHHGALRKMNNHKLFQQWKPRYFVLDTNRHQLRYYDTMYSEVERGSVDLQEVRSVRLLRGSHAQRVGSDFEFELETTTRTYRFAADSQKQASEWVEHIQSAIQ